MHGLDLSNLCTAGKGIGWEGKDLQEGPLMHKLNRKGNSVTVTVCIV